MFHSQYQNALCFCLAFTKVLLWNLKSYKNFVLNKLLWLKWYHLTFNQLCNNCHRGFFIYLDNSQLLHHLWAYLTKYIALRPLHLKVHWKYFSCRPLNSLMTPLSIYRDGAAEVQYGVDPSRVWATVETLCYLHIAEMQVLP